MFCSKDTIHNLTIHHMQNQINLQKILLKGLGNYPVRGGGGGGTAIYGYIGMCCCEGYHHHIFE